MNTLTNTVFIVITILLLSGCGPTDSTRSNPGKPALAVPNHLLTDKDAGQTLETEAGDTISVRLTNSDQLLTWRPVAVGQLELIEEKTESVVDNKSDIVQVFRFQTRTVGNFSLTFSKYNLQTNSRSGESISFSVSVR